MSGIEKRKGQGMTEYIIIVAVVAVLSLAIVLKFGNQIRNLFVASSKEMAGEKGDVQDKMGAESGERQSIKEL
jgi:Flp pilus assembly pilin Flp